MAQIEKTPKLISRRSFEKIFKSRSSLRDNLSQVTKSFFAVGGEKTPEVETKIIPVERVSNGRRSKHYKVRVEIRGVRLGERSSPPPLKGEVVKKRIATEDLAKHEELLSAFVPDHLAIDPRPRRLVKAYKRIPARLDRKIRYKTTIFNPDQRQVFQDTSYPWSAFGRCETNLGPFSGVMIGPRHLLTCNHGIDWTPPSGFAADWLTFTPSYFDGNAPFGSTYPTHIYWVKAVHR